MKRQILVIDDEASIRELLGTYFERHDFDVALAENGAEAMDLLSRQPVELVILDVLLGDADGLDLLSSIRESNPDQRIVVMTGIGADQQLLHEAKRRGAAGFVSKTLPLDQLLKEVRSILDSRF